MPKLTQLSGLTSICQWINSFLTDRQQVVRLGKYTSSTRTISTGAPQGCVLSPFLFSSTPKTAHLKTPPSSSWSLQMTPQSSTSFRTVTSLLTDRRLKSWFSGAVLTTWSSTCSKLWRWSWTSGEPSLLSPPLIITNSTLHCEYSRGYFLRSWGSSTCPRSCLYNSTLPTLNPSSARQ